MRTFVKHNLTIHTWENIHPYFEQLLNKEITSLKELKKWLSNLSELEGVIGDTYRWLYIKTSTHTEDKEAKEKYGYFIQYIMPHITEETQKINLKFAENAFCKKLDKTTYLTYKRNILNDISLFRKENIALQNKMTLKENTYGAIAGKMTVEVDKKEYTLQQAAVFLKNPNRDLREKIYKKIAHRRIQDTQTLNELLDELIDLRVKIAHNAGFENYRDYKFQALGRFDYTPKDCFAFHKAIETQIVPIINQLQKERKNALGYKKLKPWDLDVDPTGATALRPFKTTQELIEKSIHCFEKVDPLFATYISQMDAKGHLDLDSRKGKAPGGYNMSFPEGGIPFIFMNAAKTEQDVHTFMHEGGHAVHAFLSHHLPLNGMKDVPSEIAELASMSMELFTLDYWDIFYPDKKDLQRAKINQIKSVLSVFSSVAMIDAFQHWLYTHPEHSHQDRADKWMELQKRFGSSIIDWNDVSDYQPYTWQRVLHIFEVPFYYIEYAIAQLGAIAMWQNFKRDKEKTIEQYKQALQLGYSKPIAEVYQTAGIQFNFSQTYVRQLIQFVQNEYELIKKSDSI